jgi:Domain of unknown function (DUF4349)/Putative zinc-finger
MSTATHPFAPEEIMAFVDGELSLDLAQSLSAHIGQCAECSSMASGLRGLSRQMTGWQVETVPERLNAQVTAAVAEHYRQAEPIPGGVLKRHRSPIARFGFKVASTIAAVLLVLAITVPVPNLLRSRMAANEASAVGSLRILNTAAVAYLDTYGHYPGSLESLGSSPSGTPTEAAAGLIDDALARGRRKSGYFFTYRTVPAFAFNSRGGYTINADPLEPGKGGQRHFSTDQTGTIFADGVNLFGSSLLEKSHEPNRSRNAQGETVVRPDVTLPMIARKAQLEVVVVKLDDARQTLDRILTDHQGYVAQLSATAESGSARIVVVSLRVPADQLDWCLAELKKLGRVTQESQAGEEVTRQHVDLVVRLKNSRNTEGRLNAVLQQRSGPIKEILEVEKESARVRGEIEQMEAEQKNLEHRVDFATIDLKLAEEYKAQLTTPAPSVAMQLRNAAVDGFRTAFQSLLALSLSFAESGPTLLLWLLILLFPARLLWRRYQRSLAMS